MKYLEKIISAMILHGNDKHPAVTKGKSSMGKNHDNILYYSLGDDRIYNTEYIPYTEDYINQRFHTLKSKTGRNVDLKMPFR